MLVQKFAIESLDCRGAVLQSRLALNLNFKVRVRVIICGSISILVKCQW